MADSRPLTTLSICSGIGGIELGISLVAETRVLGFVEREAFAAGVLLARMDDEALGMAPVWCGNLEDFDARPFAGVDLVTAGLPCQPYSLAGKREGDRDERAIWPEFIRIVSECRPAMVFLENVPAFVVGGFCRRPGEELSRMGYRIERPLFLRASDLGAPHRRERVFILASLEQRRGAQGRSGARPTGEAVAHASSEGRQERREQHHGERTASALAHPNLDRLEIERGGGLLNRERKAQWYDAHGCSTLWPPGPAGDWSRIPEELHPARPKSELRCLAHGLPFGTHRLDELRAFGNAVVPAMAGAAFWILARDAGMMKS